MGRSVHNVRFYSASVPMRMRFRLLLDGSANQQARDMAFATPPFSYANKRTVLCFIF